MIKFDVYCESFILISKDKLMFNIAQTATELAITLIVFLLSIFTIKRIKRRDYSFLCITKIYVECKLIGYIFTYMLVLTKLR